MTRCVLGIIGAAMVLPAVATAQRAPQAGCPVANGLIIQTSGDSASPATPSRPSSGGLRVDARDVIDTVWTFNITERRWTRPFFSALIGLGWASNASTSGTSTAPDTTAAGVWSACAGARIEMRDPTLVLRGARGQVHLRADVRSLSRTRRESPSDSTRPRR